ncbi:hypothetical protein [Limobrevibacterium gyesilva]|uniref:Lipoprotein n=1 Tax=Limobrevibacterium gyesilva TaxID=2991712 RepID=A0AA41YNG8_9PROT|nr:hypothetical protein [Limobrevibacterium gyesilva]MCW3477126.1 hypothetical protein [Limobrevibacterium gyesilva]
MVAWRHGPAALALGIALAGCSGQPPLATPAAAPPSPAYDGTYRGAVDITYIDPMAQKSFCNTDRDVTLQVTGGTFTYAQPHPGYPDRRTVTYTAAVAADGSFKGNGDQTGTISGRIAGGHMTGNVDGVACFYTLNADRS